MGTKTFIFKLNTLNNMGNKTKLTELGSGSTDKKAGEGLFRACVMIDSCIYQIGNDTTIQEAIEFCEEYNGMDHGVQIFDDEGFGMVRSRNIPKFYGKLIVIDGTDGTGKATQTKKLIERLKSEGIRCKTFDFPHYQNHFGGLIGEGLAGKHGDFVGMSPYIVSSLYAADRFESSEMIKRWLSEGAVVILDRYVSANQIHQGGKINTDEERQKFLAWLDHMEHVIFKIPRPDIILYLDLPLEISQKLLQENIGKEKKIYHAGSDQHEDNPQHLLDAKQSGVKMVQSMNTWKSIECGENGEILPIGIIHEKIWQEVQEIINA
jgi:dTMP kinase